MNQSKKLYLAVAAALIAVAVVLMLNGQILGVQTTDLSRILLIIALPLIVKGRKYREGTETQRETL
ncbi:MAG: hypothetical protein JSW05_02670 [Candidatus Thorarchaeota archaeon]|nr:MAG: hypothetical protein JSW05_02670 [Candidatus Thorarchaeota archaeon]